MREYIIGITTTPNRRDYLDNLILSLRSEGFTDINIFNDDEYKGHLWNKKRCFEFLFNNHNGKTIIHLEDDIQLCENFKEELNNVILNCKGVSTLCLFARGKHLLKHSVNGLCIGIYKRCYYEQAVVFLEPFEYSKFEEFCEGVLKNELSANRYNHHDVRVQEFFVRNNKERAITVPTLVEHIGIKSTMKHIVGKSVLFKG